MIVCLAVFPPCEGRGTEAEALEGAQQVEAAVLGFGFRMNDLRQLAGERHFASNRPQVVRVLGTLISRRRSWKPERVTTVSSQFAFMWVRLSCCSEVTFAYTVREKTLRNIHIQPPEFTKTCRVMSVMSEAGRMSRTSDSWYFLLKWALIAALCAFFWAFIASRSFLQTQQTETEIHLMYCRQGVIKETMLPQHRVLQVTSLNKQ